MPSCRCRPFTCQLPRTANRPSIRLAACFHLYLTLLFVFPIFLIRRSMFPTVLIRRPVSLPPSPVNSVFDFAPPLMASRPRITHLSFFGLHMYLVLQRGLRASVGGVGRLREDGKALQCFRALRGALQGVRPRAVSLEHPPTPPARPPHA